MLWIEPNWQAVIGLGVALVLGEGVGCLVRKAGDSIGPLEPPNDELAPLWKRWSEMNTAGQWIGRIERPLFFAAAWLGAGLPLAAWLAMKTAFYWQGTNFAAFPRNVPGAELLKYVIAKRQLGTHHVATFLVGTGANIIVALAGYAIAKWIRWS